jgi:hypothetical protein
MNSTTTITSQPVVSYQTEPTPTDLFAHQCLCEKCMTYLCKRKDSNDPDNACCSVNFRDWFKSIGTSCNMITKKVDCLATLLCLPIKLPLCIVFGLPCTIYNEARNACKSTNNKNYVC